MIHEYYRTIYAGLYITHPWADFYARYLHGWNSVGAMKVGGGNISPRELPKDASFDIGALLVAEQWSLKTRPKGCVM